MLRTVEVNSTVSRIVSLVPSQTELLADLGLRKKLVGITKFCIHPSELRREVQLVGGTKNVRIDLIRSLKPDLIIGNREENNQADIEVLEKEFPVWMSDIFNLEDALEMLTEIGKITGAEAKAGELKTAITNNFEQLHDLKLTGKSVLYLIWKNPYIAAGKHTFIDAMLQTLGFENAVKEKRYPEAALATLAPDFVFLSSEPYPFKEKDTEELQQQFPASKIVLVNGEYFSWYGSRLLGAPAYFLKLSDVIAK
ncbi:helical backbone metal receptor [Fluviicola sp.]|jgi:ABC-type Fe3+-hydroxamate transport system substrate-binding protein|uniref:ABC transporter substrate-binding protein n=1 Tax=Fluviicola sp. TaxID=1917219 RepID=UPI002830C123|nr:helical backbone metal receptor [Fluviicola sp.]MDR0801857.1 helical backbone metal receptor [Fluviicola sp.]